MYQRKQVATIVERLQEVENPLIQAVVGARQTGKSTMITQALQQCEYRTHSVSADDVISPDAEWLRQEWQQARNIAVISAEPVVLAIDEIQKVPEWSSVVKGLWDADRRENRKLKVLISGSSSLLIAKGMADSLQGRFEIIRSTHWCFNEMEGAFGYTLDDFLFFGGYPGAARFRESEARWRAYMRDAIIEPSITKDVLANEDIRKPALMRSLFELGAQFSAQELSYNKMLGQLSDAGNTTTLAHYLSLLNSANILCGLQKYHPKELERKASSPRLMVYDTGLMTAASGRARHVLLSDSELRGHLIESAIGAYLLAQAAQFGYKVEWWWEGNDEVDFVIDTGAALYAVEVKSGRTKSLNGMRAFLAKYPHAIRVIVGGDSPHAISVEDFLRGGLL